MTDYLTYNTKYEYIQRVCTKTTVNKRKKEKKSVALCVFEPGTFR